MRHRLLIYFLYLTRQVIIIYHRNSIILNMTLRYASQKLQQVMIWRVIGHFSGPVITVISSRFSSNDWSDSTPQKPRDKINSTQLVLLIRNFRRPNIEVAEASTRSADNAYLDQLADDYAAAV